MENFAIAAVGCLAIVCLYYVALKYGPRTPEKLAGVQPDPINPEAQNNGTPVVKYPADSKQDGRTDAKHLSGSAAGAQPPVAPGRPAAPPEKVDRKELLKLFDMLKSHQYDDLVFRLEVPVKQRPSEALDLERRKNALLGWADENSKPAELLDLLREMVGEGGANHPR